jgi:outer membrane protein assembly factor BamA
VTADFIAKVLAAATMLAVIPQLALAQDLRCEHGDVEVRALEFVGNKTFSSDELANVIVTTPSAWGRRTLNLPFSAKRCLNRTEYANDRLRLMIFYRQRGFPDVAVDTALLPSGLGGVRVRFKIVEGVPIILHALTISGLDSVRRQSAVLRNLPTHAGERFDRTKIDASMDSLTHRLRNRGYPATVVTNWYAIHSGPSGPLAEDSLTVRTGPLTRVGATHVTVVPAPHHQQQIPDAVVRRLVKIDSGRIYREQNIADAQRRLYQTDAYLHVAVGLDSAQGRRIGSDSIAPLDVSLAENTMHTARVGAGYGTLDCFRVSGEVDDYNFLSEARHLAVQGRVSKIGVGEPLGGASQLCPQARQDPYSTQLNYYLGATLTQPYFFGLQTVPTLTAYTSRVSEYNAYVQTTTIGGIASVVWQRSVRTPITFSYSMDLGRTQAQPALFCAVFNLCDSDDRARVQQNLRLAVVSAVVAHDGSNNAVSPTAGGTARFEVRYASPWVLSDSSLRFSTLLGDVARYISVGGGNVLALHLRAGAVFGGGFVPPQERLYAGGPTSVRGFAQNELGAATYITQTYDTVCVKVGGRCARLAFQDTTRSYQRVVPVGGNSLVVGNVELRLRSPVLPNLLQFALFTDAGDVWNRSPNAALQNVQIQVTPGVQVAALTPIGPVRLVVGYNPYQRPKGSIYYESSSSLNGALPCVSPFNTIPVGLTFPVNGQTSGALAQASGGGAKCPATFQPANNTSFRSRLTLGLAIGQSF